LANSKVGLKTDSMVNLDMAHTTKISDAVI
jgi:hypothetical protein